MEFHIDPPSLNRPNGLNKAGGGGIYVGEVGVAGAVAAKQTSSWAAKPAIPRLAETPRWLRPIVSGLPTRFLPARRRGDWESSFCVAYRDSTRSRDSHALVDRTQTPIAEISGSPDGR